MHVAKKLVPPRICGQRNDLLVFFVNPAEAYAAAPRRYTCLPSWPFVGCYLPKPLPPEAWAVTIIIHDITMPTTAPMRRFHRKMAVLAHINHTTLNRHGHEYAQNKQRTITCYITRQNRGLKAAQWKSVTVTARPSLASSAPARALASTGGVKSTPRSARTTRKPCHTVCGAHACFRQRPDHSRRARLARGAQCLAYKRE